MFNESNKDGIIYKHEVEKVATKLKNVIYEMEELGNRYYNGRPINIQDAIRHSRIAHQRLIKQRNNTVKNIEYNDHQSLY